MKTPLYWIPGPWTGRLATAPRPRGGEWLDGEIAAWKADGITMVVSTLTRAESQHLALEEEERACRAAGISFLSFPILDCDIPASHDVLWKLLMPIEQRLATGSNVAIHCRMGIGRSSTLAACLFVLAGVSPEEAFDRICRVRGCTVPDTPAQRRWVEEFARNRPDLLLKNRHVSE